MRLQSLAFAIHSTYSASSYNEHLKAYYELQKRIEKLTDDDYNRLYAEAEHFMPLSEFKKVEWAVEIQNPYRRGQVEEKVWENAYITIVGLETDLFDLRALGMVYNTTHRYVSLTETSIRDRFKNGKNQLISERITRFYSGNVRLQTENIKAYFTEVRRKLISVQAVETLAVVPPNTLLSIIQGDCCLPEDYLIKIIDVLQIVGYDPAFDYALQRAA
ncbi:hypothetical protein [Arsenicibacter rosenii]|uniref:Uncharacterized protein n=1 Tax=Arsenicibacter rosenii TaxID=1750698 RepID=A0A1S2VP94_9BACT|nr:hypothetical protein [Arsenicibacter rosenii]OIN60574.1 hypothetical protein BLX24_00145 [Arsenicibacter rosenii]